MAAMTPLAQEYHHCRAAIIVLLNGATCWQPDIRDIIGVASKLIFSID
jgi:hypothetical protein